MKVPVFIIYPETFVLYQEALKDRRFEGESRKRIHSIVSSWDAAIQLFGDKVLQVNCYIEDGYLEFDACCPAKWDGEAKLADEED